MNRSHKPAKRTLRERLHAWRLRIARGIMNRLNEASNRKEAYLKEREDMKIFKRNQERQAIINSMTNWQRNKAGVFCKGNWKDMTTENLKGFARMPHHKARA